MNILNYKKSRYNSRMKYTLLILILLLSACSTKNYEISEAKIIIIKSPKIKFADIGYVRSSDNSIELEMYMAGHIVQRIHINHLICVDAGCMSKSGFNDDYLVSAYPSDLLQNILLGREIYDGKAKEIVENGFEQKISTNEVDINYKVSEREIFFKDRKNKIIFKIKDTK